MPLPLLAMAIGGGIGAGIGSYGHDNWGWSKDAIWQGAGIGAAGGYGVGAAAGAGAPAAMQTASSAGSLKGAAAVGSQWATVPTTQAGAGAAMFGGTTGSGLMAGLTTPLIPGIAASNPLLLGAAGLTLASATSSKGSSFQDKIELSTEGKALQGEYMTAAKSKMGKAKAGDVRDKAFGDIAALKKAEDVRYKKSQGTINTIQARIGNEPKTGRGMSAVGGSFVKAQIADAGERMTGLFAPTSTLNNYRREELMNATSAVMNMSNIDNQTAMFSYGGQLAKWNANQQLSSQKGAAIGSVAAMAGGAQLTQGYMNQMKIAS